MNTSNLSRVIRTQVLLLLITSPLQAQWSVAHLSEARERPYPVVSGQYALFVTGSTSSSIGESNKVDIYDANSGLWTVHELPYTDGNYIPNAPVAAADGRVFFAGDPTQIHIFDPAENSWTTAPLSEARTNISVGIAGDYVVFAGGQTSPGTMSTTVDLYHLPTNTWHVAQLSEARVYLAIAGLGDKIFMAGGFHLNDLSDRIDILHTGSWTYSTGTLVEKRGLIEAVTVGNKVLFAGGGVFDFFPYKQVDIYDGDSDSWSAANLTQNQFAGVINSAVAGNKVYFQGGDNQSIMDVYDAATGEWSIVETPTDHVIGDMTALGNKLYLAGGVNDFAGVVEVYDCISGTWDTLGYLSVPRDWVSTAAAGNRLLIAGGFGPGYSDVVDIYTGISSSVSSRFVPFKQPPYPNPAHNRVYIPLPEDAGALRLTDMHGRLVYTAVAEQSGEKELNTAGLSPGIYLVEIKGSGKIYRSKIVIE